MGTKILATQTKLRDIKLIKAASWYLQINQLPIEQEAQQGLPNVPRVEREPFMFKVTKKDVLLAVRAGNYEAGGAIVTRKSVEVNYHEFDGEGKLGPYDNCVVVTINN